MITEKIYYKKIIFITFLISLVDVIFLSVSENWFKPGHIGRLIQESFLHLTFIIAMTILLYLSAKVDKKLWFTKYILSGFLLLSLALYNFGIIAYTFFSKYHDIPYSVEIVLSTFIAFPFLALLFIVSFIERYLKQNSRIKRLKN